jgi:hypothetical protein
MKIFCLIVLLLGLCACSHLDTQSPGSVDLSGTWEIDARRSDPTPLVAGSRQSELDAEADRAAARYGEPQPIQFDGPIPLLPMVSATQMTIAQDAVSMGIDYPGSPYRDLKWGTQKRGLFRVDAGWDMQKLIIETRSEPLVIREIYTLSDAGNTLTLMIDLNGKRIEKLHIRRVFVRKSVAATDGRSPLR